MNRGRSPDEGGELRAGVDGGSPEMGPGRPDAPGDTGGTDRADTAYTGNKKEVGRVGAGDEARGAGKAGKKPRSFWKELPILIGIAIILALIIKTFLLQAFSIPSASMQDTLQIGDRVLVDKLTPLFHSKPSRGDVVVFHDPGGWLPENPAPSVNAFASGIQSVLSFIGLMPSANEKDLIKRVIAVGGDTVECRGTGPVIVNGKPLTEPYIYPGNTPCGDRAFGPVEVPPNRIWVMGDHRQDSLDSRYHQGLPGGGTVSDQEVVGRAIIVAWPVNHWATLPIPSTFQQPGINSAASAASVALGAAPAALGFAGAVPLVLAGRRRFMKSSVHEEDAEEGIADRQRG